MLLSVLTVLSLIVLANTYTFATTKEVYNGTTGYNGLFTACRKINNHSKPCTYVQLLSGVWLSKIKLTSWVLDISINCLGYTDAGNYTDGTCLMQPQMQLTTCTCEMYQPICCYY